MCSFIRYTTIFRQRALDTTTIRIFVLLVLTTPLASSNPLKNKELNCCTLHQFPTVYADQNMEPFKQGGLAIAYLTELERRVGFKCKTLTEIDEPGAGFTEFIHEMSSCQTNHDPNNEICKCEMGVGGWTLTYKRYGFVDFLPIFLYDDFRVITHVDNVYPSSSGLFFLTSFSSSVWIALMGLVVVWTGLKMLDNRFAPPDNSFEPLPDTESWYRRQKHFILKSNILRRLRKSFQNTGKIYMHYPTLDSWITRKSLPSCN